MLILNQLLWSDKCPGSMVRPDWPILEHKPTIVNRGLGSLHLDHKEREGDASFKKGMLGAKQFFVRIFPISLFFFQASVTITFFQIGIKINYFQEAFLG